GYYSFFFFQAEDGIRDRNVTGVQTCALPISITSVISGLYKIATPIIDTMLGDYGPRFRLINLYYVVFCRFDNNLFCFMICTERATLSIGQEINSIVLSYSSCYTRYIICIGN